MATSKPTYTPNNSFGFNITLGLGPKNQQVTIGTSDISKIGTEDLIFQLPAGTTVTIGTFTDFITWLNAQIAKAITTNPPQFPVTPGADWPDFLKNIFNGILNTEVAVTRLIVEQDKKDASGDYPPLIIHLSVVATAATPISIADGLFSIVGGGIIFDRTYTTT